MGIRPEHVSVWRDERSGGRSASVYVTELMGSETFVILQVGSERITARAAGDFRADPDSRVWIDFDMTKAHWFDPDSGDRV